MPYGTTINGAVSTIGRIMKVSKTNKDQIKYRDPDMAEARSRYKDKWFRNESKYRRRPKHPYENFGEIDELLEDELFPQSDPEEEENA